MYKTVFVSFLVGALLGSFITYKVKPNQIVEVEKDRIVEIVKEEKSPNGAVVITKTISRDIEKIVNKPEIKAIKKNYGVGAFYKLNGVYGVTVEKRIMADLWLGLGISQDKEIFVNMKYEF